MNYTSDRIKEVLFGFSESGVLIVLYSNADSVFIWGTSENKINHELDIYKYSLSKF